MPDTVNNAEFTTLGCFQVCPDGKRRGSVIVGKPYGKEGQVELCDWRGKRLCFGRLGPVVKMGAAEGRHLNFELEGYQYHGRFLPAAGDYCRVLGKRSKR